MESQYTGPPPKRRRVAANEGAQAATSGHYNMQIPTADPYKPAYAASSHCFQPTFSLNPSQVNFPEAQTSSLHDSRHNIEPHYPRTTHEGRQTATNQSFEATALSHQNLQMRAMNPYMSAFVASSHSFQPATSGNFAFSLDPNQASFSMTQNSSLHLRLPDQAYHHTNPFTMPINSGPVANYDACSSSVLSPLEHALSTSAHPVPTPGEMNIFDGTGVTVSNGLGQFEGWSEARPYESVGVHPSAPSSLCNINQDEMVCFGVIGRILGTCQRLSSAELSAAEVTLLSAESFSPSSDPEIRGHVATEYSFLLRDILESGIELRIKCSFESNGRDKQNGSQKRKLLSCALDIAIYAPFSMFQEIKEWSEQNDIFLQDPTFCFWDAKYCNPQRLSLHFDTPRMVSESIPQTSEHRMRLRSIIDEDDFLDKYLASKVDLAETEQPSAVKTALKSHQKKALTFMLRREKGWALHGPEADVWSILDNANGRFYINAVSESGSRNQPPPFCGGVIADPMGLGKTLTMIALAATDLLGSTDNRLDSTVMETRDQFTSVSATLIIVPPPLLRVWENQIFEHVAQGALRLTRHYAKSRITSLHDLNGVDVVLTTYNTAAKEWSETGKSTSILFAVKWKRLILDEAHVIRNESSHTAKAMCALVARCRWAVTGTPIQNHLNDLASLLQFIRAYPYESKKAFEVDISDYWKDGKAQEAATRLQRLSSCLFLRRPKSTVQLPARYNKEYPVDFTPQEREAYRFIKDTTYSAIDDALQQGHGSHRSGACVNILHKIESLRLFCGLGMQYHSRHDEGSIASHISLSWETVAQKTFKMHLEMGSMQCLQCHTIIDFTQSMFDDPTAGASLFSRCLKFVCAECAARLAKKGLTMPCGHTPSCPAAPVSTSIDAMDQIVDEAPTAALPTQMPSKVAALISDLQSQPADVKSVVFSTWRLTLNVVAAGLEQAGIQYLRFDGSIQQKDRHDILTRFKKDPLKRVLLLTFSCGAVGLTLTEASRAYLLEPHWNPTIEEQALGRIHRIGQEKEVTTVRLFVRDSFEMHVMNVQQSKKDLAQVILAPHDGLADTTLERLQKLRSLL